MPIINEITALEREYWDSMITKDPRVAQRLTADESLVVGAQGVNQVGGEFRGQRAPGSGRRLFARRN